MPTPSHTWHKAGALSRVVGAYRFGRGAARPQAGGWTEGWAEAWAEGRLSGHVRERKLPG
jgi:hypothetical protein